ncbi:MAG: TetR/AcrR family transcriptional regulator [Thermogutta sp.]
MAGECEDTKSRLLTAAGELFAERGFEGATARQICDRAGVNLAAINYHFKSKEHLYIEAVKAAAPVFHEELAELEVKLLETPTEIRRARAAEFLKTYIRLLMHHMVGVQVPDWKIKLIMREMLEPTSSCQNFFHQHVQRNVEILMRILDLLLPPRTPQHRRMQTALSIIAQCVHYRMARDIVRQLVPNSGDSTFAPDALATHITEFVFSALDLAPPFVRQWEGANPEYQPGESDNQVTATNNQSG